VNLTSENINLPISHGSKKFLHSDKTVLHHRWKCKNVFFYKKLSWCWQTRATRLEVNQGHQTVAFHMLGIVTCATY